MMDMDSVFRSASASVERLFFELSIAGDAASVVKRMRERMPRRLFFVCEKCPNFKGVSVDGYEYRCQKTKYCPSRCPHFDVMKAVAESQDDFEKEMLFDD